MSYGDREGASGGFDEPSTSGDGTTGFDGANAGDNIPDELHDGSMGLGGEQAPGSDGSGLPDFDARAKKAVRPEVGVTSFEQPEPTEQSISVTQASSTGMPPPIMLEHYEKIIPGSSERFLCLVEEKQKAIIRQNDEIIAIERSKVAAWSNKTNAEAEGDRAKNKEVETKRKQSVWEFIFSIALRAGVFAVCVSILFFSDFSSTLKIAVLLVLAGIIIFSSDVVQTMAKSIKSIISFFQK